MLVLTTFWELLQTLVRLVVEIGKLGLSWSLLLGWIAWWLWGVNWHKAWPVLRQGAWAPLVLLMFLVALVWSRIAPSDCPCLGFTVPNFYWQLGEVGLLAAIALFCGWVQSLYDWAPGEVNLDPSAAPSHDDHGHH